MNYNNQSNITSNHIKSDGDRIRCDQKEQTINAYAELVKKNIDFDVLLHTYSREQDLVEEIYQLILETVQTEKDMIRIAGEYYPAGFVKGKLLKLNYSHIEYVLECMDKNTTKVRNIKQYLLAALFNAPSTIGSYYKAAVNHDMPRIFSLKSAFLILRSSHSFWIFVRDFIFLSFAAGTLFLIAFAISSIATRSAILLFHAMIASGSASLNPEQRDFFGAAFHAERSACSSPCTIAYRFNAALTASSIVSASGYRAADHNV